MLSTKRQDLVSIFLLTILCSLGLASWWSLLNVPTASPLEDPNSNFVVYRAHSIVKKITSGSRKLGTTAHDYAKNYLMEELGKLGCTLSLQKTYSATAFRQGIFSAPIENILCHFPGESKDSIMLMSHYDSVHMSPGAGDAASGVAIILESLQKISLLPRKNSLLVVLTDGEENGLLGAAAFAKSNLHKKYQVKIVINLEARGNSGPFALFETHNFNNLISKNLKSIPYPVGNSFMDFLYQFIPNETDLSVFKSENVIGLNFAFAKGLEHYHKSSDTPANLSLDSLKHAGENISALTQSLLNENLNSEALNQKRIFQDLFGKFFLSYSPELVKVLSLIIILIILFLLFPQRKLFHKTLPALALLIACFGSSIYLTSFARNILLNFWTRDEIIIEFYFFYFSAALTFLVPAHMVTFALIKRLKSPIESFLLPVGCLVALNFNSYEIAPIVLWPALALTLHFLFKSKWSAVICLLTLATILPQSLHSALIADSGTQFLLPSAVLGWTLILVYAFMLVPLKNSTPTLANNSFFYNKARLALLTICMGTLCLTASSLRLSKSYKRGEFFEVLFDDQLFLVTDKKQKINTLFDQEITQTDKELLLSFLGRWGIMPTNFKVHSTNATLERNPEFMLTQNKIADGSIDYFLDIPTQNYRCIHILLNPADGIHNVQINEQNTYPVTPKKFATHKAKSVHFIESCQISKVPLKARFTKTAGSPPLSDVFAVFVEETHAPDELEINPQNTIMSHFSNSLYIIKKIAL